MNFNHLLNFDNFVAPALIRIVYWIGIVLIILGTLAAMAGGGAMAAYGGGGGIFAVLIALLGGACGLLFWRVMCEVWMVIFSINDRLGVLVDRGKV